MDKQKNVNNSEKNAFAFENLKLISNIVNGGGISNIVSGIKKGRMQLDAFIKEIKTKVGKDVSAKIEIKKEMPESIKENKQNSNFNNAKTQNNKFQQNQGKQNFVKDFKKSQEQSQNKNFSQKPNNNQKNFSDKKSGTGFSSGKIAPTVELDIVKKPERNMNNKTKNRKSDDGDSKSLSVKAKLRMGYIDLDDPMDDEERIGRVRVKTKKQKPAVVAEKTTIDNATITSENITVKELSEKIGKPVSEILKKLFLLGLMYNINSVIDFDTAELVASEFNITLNKKFDKSYEDQLEESFENLGEHLQKRPPIVTVMGHVDHGKTSLLDAIKKTNVISGEAGGITQHIGAYSVSLNGNKITFIDTPGHAAFTEMRARGAKVTDIAILVVAADDGIMPQTIEAINHIKAANVPMIVAINKMDKPEANPERIKQQLTEHDVLPEEWGGDAICVPISAKTGAGIDKLLEMVLLVADMQELKADPTMPAKGSIIESKIDKGRGIVATVLVENGTLHVGDYLLCGVSSGRIRAMVDYKGNNVKSAEPSMAVSVLGLNSVPEAGEKAYVVDEKFAKNIVQERMNKIQREINSKASGVKLEEFLKQNADNEIKTLKLIIKADVNGSIEALKSSLEELRNEEVVVKCIHAAVGGINESDVLLAKASDAIIIGFNVKPEAKAKSLAEHNGVDIKLYRVIYEAIDDVSKAITGMLAPKYEEKVVGHVEVRQLFKISAIGTIAGSYVLDGVVNRNSKIRVIREGKVIQETEIETLQQQKDQAKQVKAGFECGIKLLNFNDVKEFDILEAYENVQIN